MLRPACTRGRRHRSWSRRKSRLLRDSVADPATGGTLTYSLAKVQWAWWLVLIFTAYLAIGLVTWDYYNTFSASALALLGISTGTALGGALIDSSRLGQSKVEQATLQRDMAALPTRAAAVGAAQGQDEEQSRIKCELNQKQQRLAKVEESLQPRSKGFICDILADSQGISLHRFQICAWTIALGLVFVIDVLNEKRMPDFSPTLLSLMGISAGTYLAFKIPEARA